MVLMTVLSNIYNENLGKTQSREFLKNLDFGPEGTMYKVETKKCVVAEEISAFKKK